jgi:hypothetical protein
LDSQLLRNVSHWRKRSLRRALSASGAGGPLNRGLARGDVRAKSTETAMNPIRRVLLGSTLAIAAVTGGRIGAGFLSSAAPAPRRTRERNTRRLRRRSADCADVASAALEHPPRAAQSEIRDHRTPRACADAVRAPLGRQEPPFPIVEVASSDGARGNPCIAGGDDRCGYSMHPGSPRFQVGAKRSTCTRLRGRPAVRRWRRIT